MAGNPLMNMMNNNNPIMQMVNMLKNGSNPQNMVNMMLQKNPALSQVIQSMNGKSPEQIGEIMNNIAKEKGMDLGQVINNLGVPQDIVGKYHINNISGTKQDQTNNA